MGAMDRWTAGSGDRPAETRDARREAPGDRLPDDARTVLRRLADQADAAAHDPSALDPLAPDRTDLDTVVDTWAATIGPADTPDHRTREDLAVLARTAHRLNALPDAAALCRRTDIPVHQAARDLADLERSDRLAGSPRRRDDVLTGILRQLAGTDPAHAIGAAAELRAAARVLGGETLAEDSRIALDAREGERIDLGGGVVLGDIAPVPQADLVYVTTDGVINLAEVKATAQTLADKLRKDPKQLERMVEWRDAEPAARRVEMHISTDAGWTGMFSLLNRSDWESFAVNGLIAESIPMRINEIELSPDRLSALRDATLRAFESDHKAKSPREWFARHLPTLDAARDFLRPYGLDFL
ncbi:hypothetical protein [Allonocardiopsis opalescens]|uniref:Uncharacterized protein n=1 Tax=Allonocardiopsis opalescens TaxID=1144618 RepID=A0A2T0PW12_9ACTN|nr:hypothetical protein [Allonocardiopsis opalescens]PRX95726.1 hypothetical protein CLV72_109337 [Allonocardiopsis opalescens]